MGEVTVRPLEQSDRVKMWQFTTVCGERTQQLFLPVPWFYGLEGVDWFMGSFDLHESRRFVAENEIQEIVGIAYYLPDGEKASFGICVCDRWQRRGVGTCLMETLERDAKSRGFKTLVTSGGTHKQGMLRPLLRRRGYVNIGFCVDSSTQILKEKRL